MLGNFTHECCSRTTPLPKVSGFRKVRMIYLNVFQNTYAREGDVTDHSSYALFQHIRKQPRMVDMAH